MAAHRNLPASLATPAKRATPARPVTPEKITLYLAVADKRLIPAIQRMSRIFASRRSRTPLELRIFHEPNLPNTPFDDLSLVATLTEFGEVEGLDYVTLKPEDLQP